MLKYISLALVLSVPCSALAQDFHKGGFFDSDVSQKGFFTEEQAGIPIKNNTGLTTSRNKNDSWEVAPGTVAAVVTAEAKESSDEEVKKQQANGSDSFEVSKTPTD